MKNERKHYIFLFLVFTFQRVSEPSAAKKKMAESRAFDFPAEDPLNPSDPVLTSRLLLDSEQSEGINDVEI